MKILEKLRLCRYRGHDMTDSESPESYASNPFCDNCFEERVGRESVQLGPFTTERRGRYFTIIPEARKGL